MTSNVPSTSNQAQPVLSYASATKKAAQQPQVATGASSQSAPAVAVGDVAQAQSAKTSPPTDGNVGATPVVSTPAVNGKMDHTRQASVTISGSVVANGSTGAPKSQIQFGSLAESPAAKHSTPAVAQSASAPIAIPNNPRITSPAQSPSPIPQPAASGGGRPPSTIQSAGMTFGSHPGGDGDRQMRQASMPQVPLAPGAQPGHDRRPSGEGGMGAPNRGNFTPQGGRGRGFSNQYNNNHMNYQNGGQFRGAPQGRGGMAGQFQGQRPMQPYANSPQGPARSPALANSVPTTPNMGQAMPMQPQQQYGGYQQQYMGPPHVNDPDTIPASQKRSYAPIVCMPKSVSHVRNQVSKRKKSLAKDASQSSGDVFKLPSGKLPHEFVPGQLQSENSQRRSSGASPSNSVTPALSSDNSSKIDLSHESGLFEQMLTQMQPQQAYGYAPMPFDRMTGTPYQMYPNMGYMPGMPQPQSPQAGYQQPFIPGQYGAVPQTQAMSRNSSQISERPNSSLGQGPQTPSMAPASAIHSTPQAKPATPAYIRAARKSAALVIKNPDGEVVQLPTVKAAASPAPTPSTQTPPVVVSTPTPPPKSSTPQHNRVESKASADVAKEFQEKVRAAAAEREEAAKPEAPKAETKPAESKPVEEVKKVEEKPAPVEAKKEEASEADAAAAAAKKQQEEDEEFERQIADMEAAELEREKKEEELLVKRRAQKVIDDAAAADRNKVSAEENDRKLREQEREMERIEDERAAKRAAAEAAASGEPATSITSKIAAIKLDDSTSDSSMGPPAKPSAGGIRKPAALNLAQLSTKSVEPAPPSAALQSLKSARFLEIMDSSIYPEGIQSPNPALNAAAEGSKGFKYDKEFLLQFKDKFTEKPSVEFEAKIKALIGDGSESRAASSRGGMGGRQASSRGAGTSFPGAPAMGAFKTLPPGTTSAERYARSLQQGANPMNGSFQRPGGAFPGGNLNRQASGMGGSPRSNTNSRGGRQGSKREGGRENTKQQAELEKKMPLTAGMDLRPIEVSASGWKPRSVGAAATGAAGPAPGAQSGHLDPGTVQRKVKAALNKMTPEKFDKIADQVLAIAAQSKDEQDGRTLRQVIQLTFEKATDEAHWASMYAKFCKRMLETMSPEIRDESILDKNGNVVSGGNLFRKYLLNRCQEEFERGWKMDLPDKPEGERGEEKTEEAAMLSDEYYIAAAAKRRGLGLVQFIGELYKLGMLTERIMHECVKKLVDYQGMPDEAEVEGLSKLLKTIGGNLDATEKGRPMMDVYFSRIQAMIDVPDLQSRLKYALMDLVDLRKKGWTSKEQNKGPKTLEEVRLEAEAAAALKAAENQRGPRGGGGGGRPQQGRGDSRQFSNYGNQPPVDYNRNTVDTGDLRRLGNKARNTTGAPMSFAPTSMFSSRSNSGRKMGSRMGGGDDSRNNSNTPQQKEKESVKSINPFDLLHSHDDDHHDEAENPASPPSVASPELTKSSLSKEKSAPAEGKKDE